MSGLICIAGGKGAPGATTLAIALAASSVASFDSDRAVTLIDADPDGGDMASRLGVTSTPGLVTLAAATRHGFDPRDLLPHTQLVAPNLRLLASPSSTEQAGSSLGKLGRPFASMVAASDAIADVGRWRLRSSAADLVAEADVTILVIHPTVSGVAHARYQLDDLLNACRSVEVVCAGDRPYAPDEVASALGVESVFALPVDRRSAELVGKTAATDRWLRRSALVRSVAALRLTISSDEMVAS